MYKGKIIKIINNEAIVMVNEHLFFRIKLQNDVTVDEEVEFSVGDIIVDYTLDKPQNTGTTEKGDIRDFTQKSDLQNVKTTKKKDIKDFTRISNLREKETLKDGKPKNFTRISNKKNTLPSFSKIAGIAAVFILIFIFIEFFYTGEGEQKGLEEYIYMDIDISTSIEFVLDKDGMVNNMTLLDDKDEYLIKDVDLNDKSFINVFEMILQRVREKGHFKEGEMAVFMSATFNAEDSATVEEKLVEQMLDVKDFLERLEGNISVIGIIVDKNIREEALENNISMGRYVIYLEANKHLNMSLDLIVEKTVNELFDIIDNEGIELDAKFIINTNSVLKD